MTAPSSAVSPLEETAQALATAALGAVSSTDGWTVALHAGALPTPARAVRATVGAVILTLVADSELARHLQVGPPPADDLLEGAAPALAAAAALLGGSPEEVAEVDPGTAAGRGMDVVRAAWSDGSTVRAVLEVAAPAQAASPEAEGAAEVPPTEAAGSLLSSVPTGLERLHDVEMGVTAELGRTRMLVRDILELGPGSVIELDRAAGSPVDVLVNGTIIARGEVVVIDEEFGIRITEVLGQDDDRVR